MYLLPTCYLYSTKLPPLEMYILICYCFCLLEMMSVIFNYIRVDNEGFLTNAQHVEIVIAMAKTVNQQQQQHWSKCVYLLSIQTNRCY